MKVHNVLEKLRDLFPASSIAVGGSYARSKILKQDASECGDVDIYLNVSISRYMFKDILETVIFKDHEFAYTSMEPMGDLTRYKMPYLRKRISISFLDDTLPDLDFIFLSYPEVVDVGAYLLKFQASTISECYLKISYAATEWETEVSVAFKHAVVDRKKLVRLNIHPDVCTEEQAKKVKRYCYELGIIRIESISEPWGREQAEFSVDQKASELHR